MITLTAGAQNLPAFWKPERHLHRMTWKCPCKPVFQVYIFDASDPDVQTIVLVHNDLEVP